MSTLNSGENIKQLPPQYNPHGLENSWYKKWEEGNYFSFKQNHPDIDFENLTADQINQLAKERGFYSIVIPPPNVTGSLHLGHALNHTIQDILIRYNRMLGKIVLWVPGTDHAGIATQNVVEKLLAQESITRQQLGREEFEKRVWQWKEKSGGTITHQQRMLGESVNWNFEQFTLNENLSSLVKKLFISLYDKQLIYRAKRMVNWCPVNKTAISNIEVEYRQIQGNLYFINYPIKDPGKDSTEFLQIATTRPETMLGDVAVAVHPDDGRYQQYIGKTVVLPLMNREIPIIGDSFVDKEFGSGVVKITPAHDPNDFEVGQRHNLELLQVIDEDARINENGGPYKGLSREAARKKIVQDLEALGLLVETRKHSHQVGHNSRSGAIVEPLPSIQWFVKIQPLAEEAIRVVENGEIEFIPKRWQNTYFEWMRNIQDWCISRQLWWGHRIPAWYDEENKVYVGENEADVRLKYQIAAEKKLRQDEDVLDTWFSSGLWPFATLWSEEEVAKADSWPSESLLQKMFYPTSALVTGFDIIFFWVARMIMFGMHAQKKIPFAKVYIHGLVRDAERKKMSKSKGNVVDPLEKMQEYGTDAFRFFLMSIMPEGKDIIFDESRLKGYMAFCNKIWNTARFIWMNQPADYKLTPEFPEKLGDIDIWILQTLEKTRIEINQAMEQFRFADYTAAIYDFLWKSFCDYYLEFSKSETSDEDLRQGRRWVLNYVFVQSLKFLHPVMPFISEELYSYWRQNQNDEQLLIISSWPADIQKQLESHLTSTQLEAAGKNTTILIEVIYKIRNLRAALNIPPAEKLKAGLITREDKITSLRPYLAIIEKMTRLESLEINADRLTITGIKTIFDHGQLILDAGASIDIEKERKRIEEEINSLENLVEKLEIKLKNEDYTQKAPPELVEQERVRLSESKIKIVDLGEFLKNFSN